MYIQKCRITDFWRNANVNRFAFFLNYFSFGFVDYYYKEVLTETTKMNNLYVYL